MSGNSYVAKAWNFGTGNLLDWAIDKRNDSIRATLPKSLDGILGKAQKSSALQKLDNYYVNRGTLLFLSALGTGYLAYNYSSNNVTAPLASLAATFALSGSGNAFRSVLKMAGVTIVILATAHYMMEEAAPAVYNP